MRSPSPRLISNAVTVTAWLRWAKDAAGGRSAVYGDPSSPYPCSVQVESSETTGDHMKEQTRTTFKVFFGPGAPAVRVRDRLTWLDGGNAVLTVRSIDLDRAGRHQLGRVTADMVSV